MFPSISRLPLRSLTLLAALAAPSLAMADCAALNRLPSAVEGAMGYDSTTHGVYYCDGSAWTLIPSS